MTDTLLDYDPNDSGEISRPVGEKLTVILRRDTTGETTQNLGQYFRPDVPFDAIPRRIVDLDDTVTFHSPMNVATGLTGPQIPPTPDPVPPPPPPQPKYNMADAQPIAPLERVAGAAETARLSLLGTVAGLDGDLRPDGYVGRHRDPLDRYAVQGEAAWGRLVEAAKPGGEPRRLRVQVGVGAFIAFAAAVSVVVLAVFW